ncbi:PPC domain-containing DNA-binding protein [uncultured Faecalibaculum sp.]|uniref:PPC domain-containing DNA-binding protein n=1 Tax=uncultured Faecalibaculum sp. TaxID=1729681 RepID=UPI00261769F1|nr:PPC domain-containing DNA-binding protein [uncultured Faecalibaculum sp.]
METKLAQNSLVIRLDPGEELIESLLTACQVQNVHCAQVTVIGAAKKITCGVFNPKTKEYHSRKFKGIFEITSLNGTITTMDGGLYPHLHITFADEDYKVRGGHLNKCVISATAEIVLTILDMNIDRENSKEIGLNLFKF